MGDRTSSPQSRAVEQKDKACSRMREIRGRKLENGRLLASASNLAVQLANLRTSGRIVRGVPLGVKTENSIIGISGAECNGTRKPRLTQEGRSHIAFSEDKRRSAIARYFDCKPEAVADSMKSTAYLLFKSFCRCMDMARDVILLKSQSSSRLDVFGNGKAFDSTSKTLSMNIDVAGVRRMKQFEQRLLVVQESNMLAFEDRTVECSVQRPVVPLVGTTVEHYYEGLHTCATAKPYSDWNSGIATLASRTVEHFDIDNDGTKYRYAGRRVLETENKHQHFISVRACRNHDSMLLRKLP